MSKLFALEDIDGGVEGEELEASPEVGEVADVEADVTPEIAEVEGDAGAVDDGLGASEDLEQVEDVVADSEEEGGLTPVAAEAIRIAVESICHRVGANPKTIYSLYATENFKSASSRKANTSIALEGIRSFLKDLWAKIKAALTNIWDKAKAFFDKHLSSLGRVKKALESAKSKLSDSSGKIKGEAYLDEAPSSLATAFAGKDDISPAVITKYINAHASAITAADNFAGNADGLVTKLAAIGYTELAADTLADGILKADEYKIGLDSAPVIGGAYIVYKFERDRAEGTVDLTVDRDTVSETETKLGLTVADRSDVQGLITATLKVINDTIKLRDKFDKSHDKVNKALAVLSKKIDAASEATGAVADNIKKARKTLRTIYKVLAKAPVFNQEVFALNVKLAKAVLGYTAVCLKHYK